jgi:uncharacterized coiled-coil DUF342 family protein
VRPPGELRWLVVPLTTLAIFWWSGLNEAADREHRIAAAISETAGTVKQLETMAEQLRKRAADDETARKIAERLKQSAAQVRAEARDGRDAQRTALRELALLEQLVKELRRPDQPTPGELAAIAGALSKDEATNEAAKDIQQGNLAEAAKKLAEAAKDELTTERAQQAVREALDHLAQRNEQVSKQIEELHEKAQAGGGKRQQLLQQLSELLEDASQKGRLARQPAQQQQGAAPKPGAGKPISDEDLKQLLGALQRMKDQQQGDGEPQPGEGEGQGEPGKIAVQSFSSKENEGEPGEPDPNTPSGRPGSEKDQGTTLTPFGQQGTEADPRNQEQLAGKLAEGESLSALVPSAAKGDAKATRRYKELTEAAAAAAADSVLQENIPLGARFLIRRYFDAIRPK